MPEESATSKRGPLPSVLLRWSAWKRLPHSEMRPRGRSAQDSWAHSRGLLNAHSCTGQALSRQHGAGDRVTTGIMPLMKGRQQLPTEPLSGLKGPACPPNSSPIFILLVMLSMFIYHWPRSPSQPVTISDSSVFCNKTHSSYRVLGQWPFVREGEGVGWTAL